MSLVQSSAMFPKYTPKHSNTGAFCIQRQNSLSTTNLLAGKKSLETYRAIYESRAKPASWMHFALFLGSQTKDICLLIGQGICESRIQTINMRFGHRMGPGRTRLIISRVTHHQGQLQACFSGSRLFHLPRSFLATSSKSFRHPTWGHVLLLLLLKWQLTAPKYEQCQGGG